jgi:hypothetical protein
MLLSHTLEEAGVRQAVLEVKKGNLGIATLVLCGLFSGTGRQRLAKRGS